MAAAASLCCYLSVSSSCGWLRAPATPPPRRLGGGGGTRRLASRCLPTCCQTPAPGPRRRELMLSSVSVATLPLLPPLMGLSSYNLFPNTDIQDVEIALGSSDGALAFNPAEVHLKAGRLYRLQLRNPSSQTHYFTALEFASKAFTVLVLAGQPAVEIKGPVSEVALKGGASATWIPVPMRPGKYPFKCTVKGHTEAGMVGSIIVSEP